MTIAKHMIVQLTVAAVLLLGFAQSSVAGVVGSEALLDARLRNATISSIEARVAHADVAAQLARYGVAPDMVVQRVNNLTTAELLLLERSIDEQIAAADAVGIIGAVFLVLLILELVGITDIFKAF